MGAIAIAGLLGIWSAPWAPAWAQDVPLDDLLVVPPGTTMELFDSAMDEYDGLSFLENYDLDITVVAEARGALREDGKPRLLVTVVRLASSREAASALAAIGEPVAAEDMNDSPDTEEFRADLGLPDPYVETLPPPSRDVVARRIVLSEDGGYVEMAWATGRDVVVLAELGIDRPAAVPPIMHETLQAHRAAFPDVTMPAGVRPGLPWLRIGGVAAAALAVVGLLIAFVGRQGSRVAPTPRAAPVPPAHGDASSRARVNW